MHLENEKFVDFLPIITINGINTLATKIQEHARNEYELHFFRIVSTISKHTKSLIVITVTFLEQLLHVHIFFFY